MGLVCPELSLDLKPSYVPETINGFLKQVSSMSDASQRLHKLGEFVKSLEDEMNKIHVFKRELPLCMLLLKDAILYVKQETTQYKTRNAHQPVLEEFIPLKKDSNSSEESNKAGAQEQEQEQEQDKMNWMSSVQLWNADHSLSNNTNNNNNTTKSHIKLSSESLKAQDKGNQIVGDDDPYIMRAGSKGHDVVPLLHTELLRRSKVVEKEDVNVGRLSLLVPGMTNHTELLHESNRSRAFHPKLGPSRISNCTTTSSSSSASASASARKQRRCWSPELHRRFVDALTHLGGPQVATPKQIRELMRVDGLTNDEVKSHLQKYRLHTRRLPNDSGASTNKNGQGLSASSTAAQDQYSESSKPTSSQSASPEGPLQFPGLTGGTSTTGGDSMEEEDDDKSESYSWKGHVHRPAKDDV